MNYFFLLPTEKDLIPIQKILKNFSLPFEDIQPHLVNFILAFKDEQIIGIIGLEIYDSNGLLRSLAVLESQRNFGLGKLLVQKIIDLSILKGINDIFLLTTTAESYFLKIGFENFERINVPSKISQSEEFTSLCPSSAVCLHKKIG